jgi:signal peptidase I
MMARFGAAIADAIGQVLGSLARLTVVSLFVITFLVQPSQIPTTSMEPTILAGDFVLVNKQSFAPAGHWRWLLPYREPKRDDVIVFHYPVDGREILVKRVIASAGDHFHLHHGQVILNGTALHEPFTQYSVADRSNYRDEFPTLQRADPAIEAAWWIELRRSMQAGELPVPAGRYFAMGDNRNNSQDSRFWGFVPRAEIVGEPLFIYLSTNVDAPRKERIRWQRILRVIR